MKQTSNIGLILLVSVLLLTNFLSLDFPEPAKAETDAWVIIMSEDAEGSFPSGNGWNVFDGNPNSGEDYWDDLDCRFNNGGWSIWAADIGDMTNCTTYDNDMDSWMIYGPFDLSDATAAELNFNFWLDSESGYDYFKWVASSNGTDFGGFQLSGSYSFWDYQSFDLSAHLGDSSVWVAFIFTTDSSVNSGEGVYVDDIILRKDIASPTPTPTPTPLPILDFGDAPDSYGTLLASNGARHQITSTYRFGSIVDAEPDGQPTSGSDGDDLNPIAGPDDEDGVTVPVMTPDTLALLEVDGGPSGGWLDAWIDFNGNGVFDHPAEHLWGGTTLKPNPGSNVPIGFWVPASAVPGTTYARFRLSSSGGMTPTGLATDGEVEDYRVEILVPPTPTVTPTPIPPTPTPTATVTPTPIPSTPTPTSTSTPTSTENPTATATSPVLSHLIYLPLVIRNQ